MTNDQLDAIWRGRQQPDSAVSPDFVDGKGVDSDFMTIQIDGQQPRTWERPPGKVWREVTSDPVPAQNFKP
jgi:hypothetical protein